MSGHKGAWLQIPSEGNLVGSGRVQESPSRGGGTRQWDELGEALRYQVHYPGEKRLDGAAGLRERGEEDSDRRDLIKDGRQLITLRRSQVFWSRDGPVSPPGAQKNIPLPANESSARQF